MTDNATKRTICSRGKSAVLTELHAIALTLDQISDVLDDLVLLTELTPTDVSVTNLTEGEFEKNEGGKSNITTTTDKNSVVEKKRSESVAQKQKLLLEELAQWKNVFIDDSPTSA